MTDWAETRASWNRLKTAWRGLIWAIRERISIELLIASLKIMPSYLEEK